MLKPQDDSQQVQFCQKKSAKNFCKFIPHRLITWSPSFKKGSYLQK